MTDTVLTTDQTLSTDATLDRVFKEFPNKEITKNYKTLIELIELR